MKGKIIDAHVNEKTTYVTKQTKYGTFKGKVTVHPEDEDICSELEGYTFAEIKCDIQALKERAKVMKQRAIGIDHAFNVLRKSGIQEDDKTMRKLRRQSIAAWAQYYDAYDLYTVNRDSYNARVQRAIDYRRKIKGLSTF